MSLSIFSLRTKWHKNGLWWFTKPLTRVIGEDAYDSLRVERRIWQNRFYYIRQQWLYRIFVESPDVASMIGIYPKSNTSHGFGSLTSYEKYGDFQENTINSDGSFGMWVVYVSAIYVFHELYNYFIPWYWNKTASCKNGEEERIRLRDALASTVIEESFGFGYLEWGFGPHDTYYIRNRIADGLSHPDDVRAMACSGLNRKNRYREHYMKEVGGSHQTRMIGSF